MVGQLQGRKGRMEEPDKGKSFVSWWPGNSERREEVGREIDPSRSLPDALPLLNRLTS